jgi:hypothetical protein
MGRPQPLPVGASHRLKLRLDEKRPEWPTQLQMVHEKNASPRCHGSRGPVQYPIKPAVAPPDGQSQPAAG